MIKKIKAFFTSALGIFILYILASALAIMGFRFIYPGEDAPLAYFSVSWRLTQGLLEFFRLYPALALSALIIPFGFKIQDEEKIRPFSPKFLEYLKMPIATAIISAVIYGFISFLVSPVVSDYRANLVFQGRLYDRAKNLAFETADNNDWDEASHFLAICEVIWPGSPELERLNTEVDIQTESRRIHLGQAPAPAEVLPAWPDQFYELTPVIAFERAEIALEEERYFDAHWLATMGGRLASPGSPERTRANHIAGRAWNGVHSTEPDLLAPNREQAEAHRIFRLKLDGYNALLGGEWIRAYYTFIELMILTPYDPDVSRYLAMSEAGVKGVAFFIDEMEMSLGRVLSSAVFSLPLNAGRMVMRVDSLSTFTDSAYGIEIEIMAFDRDGRLLWSATADYAKFLPIMINSGPAVSVLMRALNREEIEGQRTPEALSFAETHPFTDGRAELVMQISWDNFLLLSNIRRGFSNLTPGELRAASINLGNYGYPPEIFEAELFQRFVRPLFLLPLGIVAISTGWRYRPMKRPRYIRIPMLGILPLVINGLEHFCRGWINSLGILAVVSLGFSASAVFFGIGIVVSLGLSMIILAAQHG